MLTMRLAMVRVERLGVTQQAGFPLHEGEQGGLHGLPLPVWALIASRTCSGTSRICRATTMNAMVALDEGECAIQHRGDCLPAFGRQSLHAASTVSAGRRPMKPADPR